MGFLLLIAGALLLGCGLLLPTDALVGADGIAREASLADGALLLRTALGLLGGLLLTCGVALHRAPPKPMAAEALGGWPVVAIALVVAVALRIPHLGDGLWYDEIVTLVEFVRQSPHELLTTYHTTNNHLLYSLCAHWSCAVFGESGSALRLPAMVFGVLGVWAAWALARRVTGAREAGFVAVLLAVAYHHVWFSQNARGYTGLLLFGTLGTHLFVRALEERRRDLWPLYGLVAGLAMFVHLSAGFVFAAHGVAYLVHLARRRPSGEPRLEPWPLAGFAIAAVATFAAYALVLPQLFGTLGKSAGAVSANPKISEWTDPVWTLWRIIGEIPLPGLALPIAIATLVVGVVGLVSLARRTPTFAICAVLPVPLTLAALVALSFHVWPRYFFAYAAFALIVLVRGVHVVAAALAQRSPWPQAGPRVAAFALAVVTLGAAVHTLTRAHLPKQDFAAARDHVAALRAPDEPVLTVGLAAFPYRALYAPAWQQVDTVAELDAALAAAPRVWLVYSFAPALATSHPEVTARIAERFERVAAFHGTLAHGEVIVCRSR